MLPFHAEPVQGKMETRGFRLLSTASAMAARDNPRFYSTLKLEPNSRYSRHTRYFQHAWSAERPVFLYAGKGTVATGLGLGDERVSPHRAGDHPRSPTTLGFWIINACFLTVYTGISISCPCHEWLQTPSSKRPSPDALSTTNACLNPTALNKSRGLPPPDESWVPASLRCLAAALTAL